MLRFTTKFATAVLLTALSAFFNFSPASAEWTNSEEVNALTNEKVVLTCQTSSNKLDFAFPYQGGSVGELCIRKSKAKGFEAIISITKGQILCSSFSYCAIQARFDDKPLTRFSGILPNDGSSTYVFLLPAGRIVNELRRSKVFKVGVTFYQGGTQVLEFDTSTYKAVP